MIIGSYPQNSDDRCEGKRLADDELNERDNDVAGDWPPQTRRIHTQPYDLSINTLLEQWQDSTLLVPQFQREYVWDDSKASRLVESLLLNIPIPVLYFSETPAAQYEIVDGHQRVSSIVRYITNEFSLTGLRIQDEFKGLRFKDLPLREQRFLKSRTMRVIVITTDSHPDMKFEVFERLNTGSVALNAQEIRQAVYRGDTTSRLGELVQNVDFRQCIGRPKPRPRYVDQELALRFLAMRTRLRDYRPPLVRFLNEYLRMANEPEYKLNRVVADFARAAAHCWKIFGDDAYRLLDRRGNAVDRNVNRALYETQMLAFAAADSIALAKHGSTARSLMADLCQDDDFLDSIQRATGDRVRTFSRVLSYADILDQHKISIDFASLGLPRAE